MIRISGVDLPKNKKIGYAIRYIYGIGKYMSYKVLTLANIEYNKRSDKLTDEEIASIRRVLEKEVKVEGSLKQEIENNIKRLVELNCYRGLRHKKNLPVRGQRTHSNSKTVRKLKKRNKT